MCTHLQVKRKCLLQSTNNIQNYLTIKKAFESLHFGHQAPNNQECPFAGTGDLSKCPLFKE